MEPVNPCYLVQLKILSLCLSKLLPVMQRILEKYILITRNFGNFYSINCIALIRAHYSVIINVTSDCHTCL